MDYTISLENIHIKGDGEKMAFFLKRVLPPILDRFFVLFFIGTLCNYFFWKIVSFIFSANYNSAIASFCFFILLFSAIDAAVRGAQAYAMLDFALAEKGQNYKT